MTEEEETAYCQGSRMFALRVLITCLRELGYDSSEGATSKWVIEREETVQKLREVCREYGDNDWEEDLHLADVVDKHLLRHLDRSDEGSEAEALSPPLSVDNWPEKPEEVRLADVPVPANSDVLVKLSQLLRQARDFVDDEAAGLGYPKLKTLIETICTLDDVRIEGDVEETDDIDHDEQAVIPAQRWLGPQDDQIIALARENVKLRRDYDRLKHLYDTRMEVTQEAIRQARQRAGEAQSGVSGSSRRSLQVAGSTCSELSARDEQEADFNE